MLPNRWYPILESRRLRRRPVGVTRLGRRLALWRAPDGRAVALPSACPHRGAALEDGRIEEGELACPWHGFRFAADGRCTLAPCEGAAWQPARGLHLEPARLREAHGLLWLWHGTGAPSPELPFFEELPDALGDTAEASYVLPYHYSRMVETNLDVHHTPFVHRRTIPGLGARVDPFEAHVDGDRIRTSGELRHEGKAKGMPFRADALLPCLNLIELTAKLCIAVAATPVDETHSWLWFRYYQSYTGWRPLGRLLTWLAVQSELRVVQRQDWAIFRELPPGTIDEVDYHLVRADHGIALYRKLRRDLLDAASRAPRAVAGGAS